MLPEDNYQNTEHHATVPGEVNALRPQSSSAPQPEVVKGVDANSVQNNPNSIQTLNLNVVDSGFSTYLRKKILIIIPVVIVAVPLAWVNPVIPVFILVLLVGYFKSRYENNLFEGFANSNNFTYQKKGVIPDQIGHLFLVGHSHKISCVVSGGYQNWPFLLFLYKYTIGYGRNQQTYHRAVITIDFNTNLPTFVLRRHSVLQLLNEEGDNIKSSGYTEKLELEGDFNKHFQVFVKPNTQPDVLTILTPDIMQILEGLDKYEIELAPLGRFYVYTFNYITKRQQLIDLYRAVGILTEKIGQIASREKTLRNQTLTNLSNN